MGARPLGVGFVGFGRIAAGFDRPEGPEIRTHLKACLSDGRFAVAMVADPDAALVARTLRLWAIDAPVVTQEAALDAALDVLCIASPDDWHEAHLERAARGSARLILCEKPWSGGRRAREAVLEAIAARGASLVINHTRRWIAPLPDWMAQARAGSFGRPLSAHLVYGRGLRHNAVHGLDLIAGFLSPRVLDIRTWGEPIADYAVEDPTCSLLATLASDTHRLPLWIEGIDGRVQSAFAVDLRFADARVTIEDDDGLRARLWRGTPTPVPGFAPSLAQTAEWTEGTPGLMAALWSEIGDHLAQGRRLSHDGAACAGAYELLDALTLDRGLPA
jgi:predicted dehydrogenase